MKSTQLVRVALLSALLLVGCDDSGLVGADRQQEADYSAATTAASPEARAAFPDIISLPNGFSRKASRSAPAPHSMWGPC